MQPVSVGVSLFHFLTYFLFPHSGQLQVCIASMMGCHSQRQKIFRKKKKKIKVRAVSTTQNLWKEEEQMGSQELDAVPCTSEKEGEEGLAAVCVD